MIIVFFKKILLKPLVFVNIHLFLLFFKTITLFNIYNYLTGKSFSIKYYYDTKKFSQINFLKSLVRENEYH